VVVVFADLLWSLIRCYFTNPALANAGDTLVRFLKWPLTLICAVILFLMHRYASGILALLWPFLAGLISVPGSVGRIENNFWRAIGYSDPT
jgi:hypothetical protein